MSNIFCLLFLLYHLSGNNPVTSQRINDPCRTKIESIEGTCKNINECSEVLNAYRNHGTLPTKCGRNKRIICCPNIIPEDQPCSNNRISCRKCQEYSDTIYSPQNAQCHHTALQLVKGGTAAETGEFPHSVLIGYEESISDDDYLCGGSLISERFVLSAAHCSWSSEFGAAKYAKMGNVIRGENNDLTFKYVIVQRIKHPHYTARLVDHDIALFKLNRDVAFSSYVAPICLPHFDKEPSRLIAIGWGQLGSGEDHSNKLMKVKLQLFKEDECQKNFEREGKLINGIDYASKLCAGSFNESKDTCGGDSGGAIQVYNGNNIKCMYTLIGLTSFGHTDCGEPNVPGVYTRIFNYLDWIEKIVWT